MKSLSLSAILFLCIAFAIAVPASAGPADIAVTSYSIEPLALMKGDIGTLTIEIKNNGVESVAIRSAKLYGNEVVPLSDPYPSVGDIGAGTTKTFTFTVRADGSEGMFYPIFVLDFQNGGSLRYPIPVQVEDTPLAASIVRKPDAFSEGKRGDITIRVGNPRPNDVSGVQVIPKGSGFAITPTEAFIGALAVDESGTVAFNLTPKDESDVQFSVIWRNGINAHTVNLALPVTFGEDKRQADLFVTNIAEITTPVSGRYQIVGDIMNAGLEPARSVIITPEPPAIPTDPFKVYVVGTLDPDDAAPFEVTFKIDGNTTCIPLAVEYRDDDGNRYKTTAIVDCVSTETLSAERDDSSLRKMTTGTIIAIIVAIGVIGAIFFAWRRK